MAEATPLVAAAGALRIAYLSDGDAGGWPVILSHGFPYDPHAFDQVTQILVGEGARVIRPFARGFGPTRFTSATEARNGQQAARGADLLALIDALDIEAPILGGFDWGGNASCVVAALWPERIAGLVSYAGYDIIDLSAQAEPSDPKMERALWYQHLFQTERGRAGLAENRAELCKILWRDWSPGWAFDDETFAQSASAFDNPDFVNVVIHCYRWMTGLETGDPALQPLEGRLAGRPKITVPAISLDGSEDPLKPGGTASHAPMFTGPYAHSTVTAGHNLPQEAPSAFAEAVLAVHAWSAPPGR